LGISDFWGRNTYFSASPYELIIVATEIP